MNPEKNSLAKARRVLSVLNGQASPDDQAWFEKWVSEDPSNKAFVRLLADPDELGKEFTEISKTDTQASWQALLEKKEALPRRRFNPLLKYAAILLLIGSAGIIGYLIWPLTGTQRTAGNRARRSGPIVPGSNKARLVLADGSELLLDETRDGIVNNNAAVRIIKKGGMLIYQALEGVSPAPDALNTIYTPRGGQYQVILPDGSRVWLNAASSLSYPVSFTADERRVKLSGEGYFEVSPDKTKPFHVDANGTDVMVLGTHFNVNAYQDERSVRATLLEGSVKVTSEKVSRMIRPGQEAVISHETGIALHEVDPEEAVAWKNGVFLFNSEDVDQVMRQLGRWYDVEAVYRENKIPDGHISGKISRKSDISEVLNLLELAGGVHATVNERRVIISD